MRVVAPEVASVSGSESARPVCTYGILMVLQYLHDCARLVPLCRVAASLILDHDSITTTKGDKPRECSSHLAWPVTLFLDRALSRRSSLSVQS